MRISLIHRYLLFQEIKKKHSEVKIILTLCNHDTVLGKSWKKTCVLWSINEADQFRVACTVAKVATIVGLKSGDLTQYSPIPVTNDMNNLKAYCLCFIYLYKGHMKTGNQYKESECPDFEFWLYHSWAGRSWASLLMSWCSPVFSSIKRE